ncbi:MAG: molybdenum cofactor biosynthesis protein MoaE [Pseudomonadales bacterium]|nr:molybdenum cofactor biosynthesis protein MoaE [Pseudomonadales bacterium]
MISVQAQDFDVAAEYAALRSEAGSPGAIVTFTGLVREIYAPEKSEPTRESAQEKVTALFLEHYPGMTEAALEAILLEAGRRWLIQAGRIIHRIGELLPTEQIVFVGIASAHRGDAFAAAEYIMDYLKTQAPFWKKQYSSSDSVWIESRDSDHDAAARWQNANKSPKVKA